MASFPTFSYEIPGNESADSHARLPSLSELADFPNMIPSLSFTNIGKSEFDETEQHVNPLRLSNLLPQILALLNELVRMRVFLISQLSGKPTNQQSLIEHSSGFSLIFHILITALSALDK